MEKFSHDGKEIVFWGDTGEVLSSGKYTETHVSVSSRGGDGHVGPNGGYINPVKVTSTSEVITHHELWIKTESGLEKDFKIINEDIPLRAGQKITIISAGKTLESGFNTALVNHNAGKYWYINRASDLTEAFGYGNLWTFKDKLFGVLIFIFISLMSLSEKLIIRNWDDIEFKSSFYRIDGGVVIPALCVSVFFMIIRAFFGSRRVSKFNKILAKHIEKVAQTTLTKPEV